MIMLVPPAFILYPEEFTEDWMDRKLNAWDDEEPDRPTVYSQPIFFYNALGQVGQKAVIGNKINPKNMEIIHGKLIIL